MEAIIEAIRTPEFILILFDKELKDEKSLVVFRHPQNEDSEVASTVVEMINEGMWIEKLVVKLSEKLDSHWWLVRATYVVDGRFFAHFFWKVEGAVRIHVNHVQLTCVTCSSRLEGRPHVWLTCVTCVTCGN